MNTKQPRHVERADRSRLDVRECAAPSSVPARRPRSPRRPCSRRLRPSGSRTGAPAGSSTRGSSSRRCIDVHLLGVAREKVRLLDGGVATADDGDALIAEERAVADRAVRDALARVLQLARDAELDRRAAGGDDHRRGREDLARVGDRLEGAARRYGGRWSTFAVTYSAPKCRACSSNFCASSQPRMDFSPIQSSSFSVFSSSPPGMPRSSTTVRSMERPAYRAGAHPRRTRADDHDLVFVRCCQELLIRSGAPTGARLQQISPGEVRDGTGTFPTRRADR